MQRQFAMSFGFLMATWLVGVVGLWAMPQTVDPTASYRVPGPSVSYQDQSGRFTVFVR